MSELKDGFYWIRKPDGSETIVEKEDGVWYYLGSEIEHDYLPDAWEILGKVANGVTTGEKQCNLPVVNGCALLNEVLDHQQEVISSPIRFNGVHIDTIKQIFGKYGIMYKNMF